MRSSIVFLGAIAARVGHADISFPGGCELGPRPIDLHLRALRKLGLEIREDRGSLECTVSGRMKGANITLSFPSVGATENILLAAATADGTTVINNAAQEPEIADLADFLNRCGADVRGAGEGGYYDSRCGAAGKLRAYGYSRSDCSSYLPVLWSRYWRQCGGP